MPSQQSSFSETRTVLIAWVEPAGRSHERSELATVSAYSSFVPSAAPPERGSEVNRFDWVQEYSRPGRFTPRSCTRLPAESTSAAPATCTALELEAAGAS